jgi:hypothetical protein
MRRFCDKASGGDDRAVVVDCAAKAISDRTDARRKRQQSPELEAGSPVAAVYDRRVF